MLPVAAPPPATLSTGATGAGEMSVVGGAGEGTTTGTSVCVASVTPSERSSAKAKGGD